MGADDPELPSYHFVFPDFSFPPSALICVICGQTFLIGNFAVGLIREG